MTASVARCPKKCPPPGRGLGGGPAVVERGLGLSRLARPVVTGRGRAGSACGPTRRPLGRASQRRRIGRCIGSRGERATGGAGGAAGKRCCLVGADALESEVRALV